MSSVSEQAAKVDVVIMAAGKGTRMKSARPKVLHTLAHRPLLGHVLRLAKAVGARKTVVITGHQSDLVRQAVMQMDAANLPAQVEFALQEPQLGTGHAAAQATPLLGDDGLTVILSGDVPLTHADTVAALVAASAGEHLALLTVKLQNPKGYGRIIRNARGHVQAIVEEKDASDAQRQVTEIYSGILAVPTAKLKNWLSRLDNQNAQAEFYLTDIVRFAVADRESVQAVLTTDEAQTAGVNSPLQLAELEREHQWRVAQALMTQGVRLADPRRIDVRGELVCDADVDIDVNCVFEGRVQLGARVRVGANCVIANATIADDAVIHPFTHIDGEATGVKVGTRALIGPFARLRPGAVLGAGVHIGNFVEVKNSTLAAGAKANHLAYLGDATVGERVNYGAGSITANYDGANKHRTVIEDDVHIGSNCVLVAPVTIGAGGTVGGGSTVNKSTPAASLTVARARQVSFNNWSRPAKKLK